MEPIEAIMSKVNGIFGLIENQGLTHEERFLKLEKVITAARKEAQRVGYRQGVAHIKSAVEAAANDPTLNLNNL